MLIVTLVSIAFYVTLALLGILFHSGPPEAVSRLSPVRTIWSLVRKRPAPPRKVNRISAWLCYGIAACFAVAPVLAALVQQKFAQAAFTLACELFLLFILRVLHRKFVS